MKQNLTSTRLRHLPAFTLMELLVVIAIVGVLGAVSFSVGKNALASARKVGAINQIRQTSSLAVSHAFENNGILADEGGEGVQSFSALRTKPLAWYNVLPAAANMTIGADYRRDPKTFYETGSLFYLKSAKYPKSKLNRAYFAYGMNSQLVVSQRPVARLNDIPEPARTALFAEAALPDEIDLLPAGGSTNDLGQPKVRDKRFVGRYNGSGIIGFADGHAEVIPVSRANAASTPAVFWEIPEPTN